MGINLSKALEFVEKLALKVGKVLLEKQDRVKIEVRKDNVDIAINVDILAEKIIISAIEKEYPKHSIFSEEAGGNNKKSDYTWYIDPLDGTRSYFRKIPKYNTCFCLFYKNEPVVSVVNIPYANQLFSACKNKGAFLNSKKIQINNQTKLKDSIIYVCPPCQGKSSEIVFNKGIYVLKNLTKKVYRLRYNANENNSFCYLALESIEGCINVNYPTKSVQDFVPGAFIAKMAGAKITGLKGEKLDFAKIGHMYIASNEKIHEQLLKIINQQSYK